MYKLPIVIQAYINRILYEQSKKKDKFEEK